MVDKQTIIDRLESEYNYAWSVYDYGSYIRVTNGSVAHYVDIRLSDDEITLRGERYGERIEKNCKPNADALLSTLKATV